MHDNQDQVMCGKQPLRVAVHLWYENHEEAFVWRKFTFWLSTNKMYDLHSLHVALVGKNINTDDQLIWLCKFFLEMKLKYTDLNLVTILRLFC